MSVKLRRYMSVWMLLVAYCFSVGAAAYAVLSCHCMGQEKGEVHICCRGCDIHTECDSHSAGFKAVCCGVDHSKVSELYTSVSSSQWERDTKVMIVDLPAILAAEMTAIPFDSVHWRRFLNVSVWPIARSIFSLPDCVLLPFSCNDA